MLYPRSLPGLCFCDYLCKTVFREYVLAELLVGPLYIFGYLSDSPFLDDLDHIVHCFDKTTKLRFMTAEEHAYVKFGSTRDNDESCNIRFGQLKLMGLSPFHLIRFELA